MQGCRFDRGLHWSNRRLTSASIAAIIAAMLNRTLVVDNANDNNDEA